MGIDQDSAGKRRRSKAWAYYAALAAGNFILGVASSPAALMGAVVCGLYSVYLYRGGRFVLWIF